MESRGDDRIETKRNRQCCYRPDDSFSNFFPRETNQITSLYIFRGDGKGRKGRKRERERRWMEEVFRKAA